MKIAYFDKICKNCDNKSSEHCHQNTNSNNCEGFILSAESYELAHELNYDKVVVKEVISKPPVKKEVKNDFLYKTNVEDWGDNHKKIWRLKLKLTTYEWGSVKQYFKYYRNRNLIGWGTTSPETVTEILVSIRGDELTQEKLESINLELQKVLKRHNLGYENDFFGEEEFNKNENKIRNLKREKRELLGFA